MASPCLHSPARRLRLESPPLSGEETQRVPSGSLDGDVVVILAVLLCAVLCAVGVLSAVRCALRCCSGRLAFRFAGCAATSLKKKALKSLPTSPYSASMKLAGGECAICLSEFTAGERVRLLPNCGHGFHANCVDRWLKAHSSCPTCRQCLFPAPDQPSGDLSAGTRQPPPPATVAPLQPETFLVHYRFGY